MKYLIILFFFLEITICKGQTANNDSVKIKELEKVIYNLKEVNKVLFDQTDYLLKELGNKDKECKERMYLFAEELKKELLKSLKNDK